MQAAPTRKRSMAEIQQATPPTWLGRSRWSLLGDVIGNLQQNREKLRQVRGMLGTFTRPSIVRSRLRRLADLGHSEKVPTVSQLLLAACDQLSFSLGADTKKFYESQGIPWVFHNVRRFIAYPTSMMDPLGLYSPRDTIIHHVLQTFHRHPTYDLVLLRAYDNGLEEMEKQAEQVLAGTHPHQRSLASLIEDGSYHARLLDDVRELRADPHTKPRPIPRGLVDDPLLMLAMDQFKDLRGTTNYAARLDGGPLRALAAFIPVAFNETIGSAIDLRIGRRNLRVDCCEPELVERHVGSKRPMTNPVLRVASPAEV